MSVFSEGSLESSGDSPTTMQAGAQVALTTWLEAVEGDYKNGSNAMIRLTGARERILCDPVDAVCPRISVIMPVYDPPPHFLEQAICLQNGYIRTGNYTADECSTNPKKEHESMRPRMIALVSYFVRTPYSAALKSCSVSVNS
jgi:hypothetical protein